jgi:hypothetical protein
MSASFPNSVKSFVAKVDGVDDVMAVDVNELQEEIAALEGDLLLGIRNVGWWRDGLTWTRVAANQFQIAGVDVTAQFPKGSKWRCKQGGAYLQGYVALAAFGGGNTTITTLGDSLAAVAITDNWISYVETPQGFPHWFSYTPVWAGFSVDPSGVEMVYKCNGPAGKLKLTCNTGTSNLGILTFTNPFTALYLVDGLVGKGINNSVVLTSACRLMINAGTNILQAFNLFGTGTWTTSGGKSVQGEWDIPF